MNFVETDWNKLFPEYISSTNVDRLKNALLAFRPPLEGKAPVVGNKENLNLPPVSKAIAYGNFYHDYDFDYFLQTDIVQEVRCALWNSEAQTYEKVYPDSIIISNSCDISFDNPRNINIKQCLFAPLLSLAEYKQDLIRDGMKLSEVEDFFKRIREQTITNIFYLPHLPGGKGECIVYLDRIFWFPTEELKSYVPTIREERIISLTHIGLYLFILKLSYHLCRLPIEEDRPFV